jgi:hypothetical protein
MPKKNAVLEPMAGAEADAVADAGAGAGAEAGAGAGAEAGAGAGVGAGAVTPALWRYCGHSGTRTIQFWHQNQ